MLHTAVTTCRQTFAWDETPETQPHPFAAGVLLGLADMLREWNDLDAAARLVTTTLELSMPLAQLSFQVIHLLVLAAPEGYVRLFADEGATLGVLLSRALDGPHTERPAARQVPADYRRTLLTACDGGINKRCPAEA